VLRYSANLHFLFTEAGDFLDRFAASRAAGFTAVEFPHPYLYPREDLRRRLHDQGLACVLYNFPMGDLAKGEKGTTCLPDRRGEFRAGVSQAIEMAQTLDCPRANCMAGIAPPGADRAQLRATLIENLQFAARAFERAGLTLCLEALNPLDVPGYMVGSYQDAIDIIAAVGAPNLRLQFDVYHLYVSERSALLARLHQALPLIEHVQIADFPGRREPGSGEIPCEQVLALLEGARYTGWVGAEYHPSPGRSTAETLSWRR
jgi:hydroxypyruvate isomerase